MATQAADARARPGWPRGIGAVHEERWTAPDIRRRLQLARASRAARCGAAVPGLHVQQGILADAGRDGGRQSGGHRRPDQLVRQDHRRAWHRDQRDFRVHPARYRPGIAWRPTLRLALGASIMWALGVWWLGEGLGGVLSGAAGPANARRAR